MGGPTSAAEQEFIAAQAAKTLDEDEEVGARFKDLMIREARERQACAAQIREHRVSEAAWRLP